MLWVWVLFERSHDSFFSLFYVIREVLTPRVSLENDRDKVFLVSFCFKAERLMEAIELYKEETLKMNEECKVFVIDGFKLSCLEVQYCI